MFSEDFGSSDFDQIRFKLTVAKSLLSLQYVRACRDIANRSLNMDQPMYSENNS